MPSIVVLSGAHLCHNPRVMKEATALARHGFEVEVLGAWYDPALSERDRRLAADAPFRFTPVADLTREGISARAANFARRLRRRAAALAHRGLRMSSRWQLGYCVDELLAHATRRRADLHIAHSEAALHAGCQLLERGRRVAVDMEDWFSEDLTPQARRDRPVALMKALESRILREGAYASCPSRAMSDALSAAYGCPPPVVIYNAFPMSERSAPRRGVPDRRDRERPSIHWVSQTLGPNRGLEDLFGALAHLSHPAEVHLRGRMSSAASEWLRSVVPAAWKDRVVTHDLVGNEELPAHIAEHDIGFAGEQKFSASHDLTVSNKILHYLLAGIAVVASDTQGQREVEREAPRAVVTYPAGDAAMLAARLNAWLGSPAALQEARRAAAEAADRLFCWERQEVRLLNAVGEALRR